MAYWKTGDGIRLSEKYSEAHRRMVYPMRGTDPICVAWYSLSLPGKISSVNAVSVEEIASPICQIENAHGHTLRIYIYLSLNGLPDGSGHG